MAAHVLSLQTFNSSSEFTVTCSSKPLRSSKKPPQPNYGVAIRGPLKSRPKIQELNLEVSPHRAVSAVRLMRIEFGGAFADLLNEQGKGSGNDEMGYVARTLGFRTRSLDDKDLRLVTDIVGGTIRWRRYLDFLILSLCHDVKTFNSMEPLLLQILRIGFYEILKLEMPPYAVVDEWMVRRWTKHLGQDKAIALMTWNNKHPSYSLRANSGKGFTRADLEFRLKMLKVPYELSPNLNDFVHIKTGLQTIIRAGLLKEGLCSVQDESAGLVVSVLDPRPGETIVDCCAAPGGKTLFIASLMNGQGMLSAIDINEGRLRILAETAKLQKFDSVITTIHADLCVFAEVSHVKFDKVLLDAPCSGLGVLCKRPDLRWNRKLEDMEELKLLQDRLLDAASILVKPGGLLVYSTCSIDPEENEERVASFLQRHPEFCSDSAERYVPPEFVTEKGFYFSSPVKHSMDGAFAARLLRS